MEKEKQKQKKKTLISIIIIFLSIIFGIAVSSISVYYITRNQGINLNKQKEKDKNYYLLKLQSLENQLIEKESEIYKLNNQMENFNDNNNDVLKERVKTLESESNTLRERISSMNSILKSKDIEISELLKKLKEFEDRYLPSEDVDHEDFKNDNFDIVLNTTYDKSYSTDPLKPVEKDDYSTKVTLKRNTNHNNLTEKEFLFEFDYDFYQKLFDEEKRHTQWENMNNEVLVKWEELVLDAIMYAGATVGPGWSIDNNKIFYFAIEPKDLIEINFLNKELKSKKISYEFNYNYQKNHILNIDEIYKSGKHYRVIIKIKSGINRDARYNYKNDEELNKKIKYYINNDWNIANYSIDEKSQNNEDIKFYWKEYKTKDEENNIPAHVDLIIYLSAKKQKELFHNLEANINEKAAILKNILNEELKTKQWYLDLDKTYEKEITSWNVENEHFTLEYNNFSYGESNKTPLYLNILRLNFLNSQDLSDN
ncbi:hypothetical protein KQ875_00425 [Mycoplasma zalophi]|uniref:Uncharacterized protein n=1 Tax=Mycoplasma zalophi TaxID=191287 RepID=A0ABS6DPJ1_9MOLU|nr:hypothetical protein [Mycoplasma zalophi]MBU4692063.1 hypothetical protein [Mycoplasma zalophi]